MQQPANGRAGNGKVSKGEGSGVRKHCRGAVVRDATPFNNESRNSKGSKVEARGGRSNEEEQQLAMQ
jgi:hypothetical protein